MKQKVWEMKFLMTPKEREKVQKLVIFPWLQVWIFSHLWHWGLQITLRSKNQLNTSWPHQDHLESLVNCRMHALCLYLPITSYLPMQQNKPLCVSPRPILEASLTNSCPAWAWVTIRQMNCVVREVKLCEMSTNKTWMWSCFLNQNMGALRSCESPFQITVPCDIQEWDQSDASVI